MRGSFSHAILFSVFATTAVNAGLPANYRLALIQVGYTDAPGRYTKLQLLGAAAEISDYYAQISNHSLNLDIAVSSINAGVPISRYFNVDANASPAESNEEIVTSMALRAWGLDHIDFSHIDGIVIANGFCGRDYTLGAPVTLSGLFLSGTFEVAYDFECGPDSRLAPPGSSGVFWGGWSHEMGHMLEIHSGTVLGGIWNGHPGGYASGYALMDSAYPSSPSAYSVLGPAFMTGDKRVFNGWLPDREVVIADASVPSATYSLRAITRTPTGPLCFFCSPQQVIKIPITPSLYYLVEARQHIGVDSLPTTLSPGGVWDEGIHITMVDESGDPPVKIINSCDYTVAGGCDTGTGDLSVGRLLDPRHKNCLGPQGFTVDNSPKYCWPAPLFHPGDSFGDTVNNIRISVLGAVSDGFSVRVERGAAPGLPDMGISPRSFVPEIPGFNVSGIPTKQLWIDSSCNGYASDFGPAALRFGDSASSQTLAVGDDLCLGHENRIYARIRNRGTAAAQNVLVHFDIGNPAAPQGGCAADICPPAFQEIGIADAQHFPVLRSISPGSEVTVYVTYTPPSQTPANPFYTPSLRVRIDPLQGEVSKGDNIAIATFGRVEAVLGNFREAQFQAPDFIYTNPGEPADGFLSLVSASPASVSVSAGQTPARLTMDTAVPVRIPLSFTVSGQTKPAAGQYAANILLSGFVPLVNLLYSEDHQDFKVIAARTVGIDVVQPSHIELEAESSEDRQGGVDVNGRLQPNVHNAIVAIDYTGRDNKPATVLVRVDANGKFETRLQAATGAPISALWAGDGTHSRAVASPVVISNQQ